MMQRYVQERSQRLVEILSDLVRTPSENRAPNGGEFHCQQYVAAALRNCGWRPELYQPDKTPGIVEHPLYWPGRTYDGRPNLTARREGKGGGRSLILSGHIDTVPVGAQPWRHEPFGAEIESDCLYGRGAIDMKAGIATNLFVAEAISNLDLELAGDLTIESVVDEEFGGANGTLAGRLKGPAADAAVVSEPSFLRVCPAQRGGRTAHLTFAASNDGILGGARSSVIEPLRIFLNAVDEFASSRRKSVTVHPFYAHLDDPVPVTVTRVHTAAWGTSEPTKIPDWCQVEFFWETMPGEQQRDVDSEFITWLEALAWPGECPKVTFPIRFLPGSAIGTEEPVVTELTSCAATVLGKEPPVQGIEGPCDLYIFHRFGIPAVLWGARGGNLHTSDEYVEIDSLIRSTAVLLEFVCRWCGVSC